MTAGTSSDRLGRARRLVEALTIGAIGGGLFAWLQMPLAWMMGAMVLTTVASLGAATSLLVYSLVNFGALRLVGGTGMTRVWIVLSVVACLAAVAIWVVYTMEHSPHSLTIFGIFLLLSFASEGLIQRMRGSRSGSEEIVP